jgi:U3 small nucleolar RNA-associated protein 15
VLQPARPLTLLPAAPLATLPGGYDHICKLWDVRAPRTATLSLEHGAPIEDLAFFPSGGLRLWGGWGGGWGG